jgi:hypothetical protein
VPYELSYAGVTLPLTTPEHQSWLESVHPPNFDDWDAWTFSPEDLADLPTPSWPREPPFRFGVLHWPCSACRPAWFHAVVNDAKLDEIRDAVGGRMGAMPLVMSDSRDGKSITAQMFLLPARPLNQYGIAGKDGWILTLTDQRFFWHWKRGVIRTPPASWDALFISLGNMLGVSIDTDLIDAAYGSPSRKWVGYFRPTATVLDAAATQIGHRVVVGLDGSVKTVRWQTAKGASDAYLLAEGASRVVSGGLIDGSDVGRYVPEALTVMFASGQACQRVRYEPDCASGMARGPEPYLVSQYLGTLAASGYGFATGEDAYASGLHDIYADASGLPDASGQFYADFVFTGANAAACAALATAAAADWYGWRACDPDVVFPGVEPWAPTGWEDAAEWTYQKREGQPYASTLIRRGPWDQFVSGTWYSGLKPCPCPDPLASGFHARLTTSGTNLSGTTGWNFFKLRLQAGAFVDDGGEFTGFVGIAATSEIQGNATEGIRVWMWPSASQPGYYEFVPVAARGFHARLTTSGTNLSGTTGWNFVKLKLDSGVEVDDGAEVEGFVAIPLKYADNSPTSTPANPVATLRVWMQPSTSQDGYYEFLPLGMRVEDENEDPSYVPIHTWRFGSGFVVTNPEDGVAKIDYVPTATANFQTPWQAQVYGNPLYNITTNDNWEDVTGITIQLGPSGNYLVNLNCEAVGQVTTFGGGTLAASIQARLLYGNGRVVPNTEWVALFIDATYTSSPFQDVLPENLILTATANDMTVKLQALRSTVTTWGVARIGRCRLNGIYISPPVGVG